VRDIIKWGHQGVSHCPGKGEDPLVGKLRGKRNCRKGASGLCLNVPGLRHWGGEFIDRTSGRAQDLDGTVSRKKGSLRKGGLGKGLKPFGGESAKEDVHGPAVKKKHKGQQLVSWRRSGQASNPSTGGGER